MDLLKWGTVSVFVGGWVIGFGAWVVLVVESIRAALCLKPEAREHRYVRWNPFNALLRPELFTEKGIAHRRHAFLALLWLLGALAICGAAGVMALALG
ncbi:MAG: hypothetical protein HYS14_03535 [Candidatus Rokubacteria bacterium]|nr:hypothetical protein [Candidatus Rokubacteria bacterium]